MRIREEKRVTIFGGSGFVGTLLVQALARRGWRIRVGVRRPDLAGHLRPLGSVGQIQPVQANVRYPDSLLRAAEDADVVVNLTGILSETGRQKFRAVHVMGAANVAAAAKAAGAARLVHMSLLGADAQSLSANARSRAMGETETLAGFPQSIIFRPSIAFGPGDGFLTRFAAIAMLWPVMPLIGGETRYQPIYVGDIAEALALAVEGEGKAGRVYELGGPDIETMRELMLRIFALTDRARPLLPVPPGIARLCAALTQWLPRAPLTTDQVIRLGIDNVVSPEAIATKRTLAAFNIEPASMDTVLPTYLWRFRPHGQYDNQPA
jgi:NADH dehydrogenase